MSSLLLDTHVFLWWRENSTRLGPDARDAIAGADLVWVSAASAWEAAIKIGLGRLRLPDTFLAGVLDSGFERLPIGFEHAEEAGRLPPHHRDPFDRMLIAQARIERLTLVTRDPRFEAYEVELLLVYPDRSRYDAATSRAALVRSELGLVQVPVYQLLEAEREMWSLGSS